MAWIEPFFGGDNDDIIQTALLAEHITEHKTINQEALVHLLRNRNCGIDPNIYKSQMAKLYFSEDPFYIAEDGLTDGGAMRAFPLVFFVNKPEFPYYVRAATRITHNTPDSILAALLIAIRYNCALNNDLNITNFVNEFKNQALRLYNFEKCKFYFDVVDLASTLVEEDPINTLLEIHKKIGLTHIAWGCPVAASFWAYNLENYPQFVPNQYDADQRYMEINGVKFTSLLLEDKQREFYHKRLDELNELGQGRYFGNDIDTFFHLSFSIACAQFGLKHTLDFTLNPYYPVAQNFANLF